jgi:tRNA nucleotidyltransferase (CCA-adding enzyme)
MLHPAARNLYTMYRDYFDFAETKDLKNEPVEEAVIVDTASIARVSEYFESLNLQNADILVFDHHNPERCDIPGATVKGEKIGSTTSLLTSMAIEAGARLSPEEATIALTGIYADTGKLLHDSVSRKDFEAALYLLDMGASIKLVKSFLDSLKEDDQIALKNVLLTKLEPRTIQGHSILLSYHEFDENPPGLAAVVERIMEIENPDAYLACFYVRKTKTMFIIARSQSQGVGARDILKSWGGGGHKLAASAKVSVPNGRAFYEEFIASLEHTIRPALRARDVMTRKVYTVRETDTMLDASLFLEKIDRSGVPVMNAAGELTGFISLRDIMKGRKANQMHGQVKGFMSRNLITSGGSITIREIGNIFFKHHIGHLPIVENGELTGIVTRWDYLQAQKDSQGAGDSEPDEIAPVGGGAALAAC